MKFATTLIPAWARILILLALCLACFAYGVHVGATGEKANQLGVQEKVAKQIDHRDAGISTAIGDTRNQAGALQAANEDSTHATQGRIRTVYLTHAVGADCRQPDGVSASLDAAIERANRRVRAAAGAPDRGDAAGPGVPRD